MSLNEMFESDNRRILDISEFSTVRDIYYSGHWYRDITMQISGVREENRSPDSSDHAQGIYRTTDVLHFMYADIGELPEQGKRITLRAGTLCDEFYITSARCVEGMIRLELSAICE